MATRLRASQTEEATRWRTARSSMSRPRRVRRTTSVPSCPTSAGTAGMLVRGFVRQARAAEQPTFRSIIAEHLGVGRRRPARSSRSTGRRTSTSTSRRRWMPGSPSRTAPIAWSGCPTTGTGDPSGSPTCSARTAPRATVDPGPATSPAPACRADPSGRPASACGQPSFWWQTDRDRIADPLPRRRSRERHEGACRSRWSRRDGLVAGAADREAARAGARAQRATAAMSCPSAAACSASEDHCCVSTSDP